MEGNGRGTFTLLLVTELHPKSVLETFSSGTTAEQEVAATGEPDRERKEKRASWQGKDESSGSLE